VLRRWIGATLEFGRDCLTRFFSVQGLDRAMALAAQAFTTLLPLLVVYGALVPTPSGADFADRIVDRLDLHGASAKSVHEAFASSSTTASSVTAIGLLLLVISALSFTRGLQRLYEGSFRLPALGIRSTRYGLQWLLVMCVVISIRPLVLGFLHNVAAAVAALGFAVVLWLATPYLLLGKRIAWRRLMPAALLTTVGMTIYSATSFIWLPRSIESLSEQFGFIGISFALVGWLFAAASVLVVAASVGAVIDERRQPA
jgi:membrane protein